MNWQDHARNRQKAIQDSIPSKWKLSSNFDLMGRNVTQVPRKCGILSKRQIELTELPAYELLRLLRGRQCSSAELTEAFCARAAIAHQLTACLTEYFYEEAMATAQKLDLEIEAGDIAGPLHGLPISLKDTFDLVGKHTTNGFLAWKDVIPDQDSVIVHRLRKAGAVFYVKTTMPQTGLALETSSNLFGRTLNPFNKDLVAGGSSGGEAVLIALHGSPMGPGSDIGGSIRIPCAFNGIYGMRPSAERTPKLGMRAAAPGQNSIKVSCGPMSRNLVDMKLLLSILISTDPSEFDITSIPIPWRVILPPEGRLLFGMMKWDGVVKPHPPILRAMEETANKLRDSGHEVIDFTPPFDCWDVANTTWNLLFPTGAKEGRALIASASEPVLPSYDALLKIFHIKELSCFEMLHYNVKQSIYKGQFLDSWRGTVAVSTSKRPMDGLICPVSPGAGFLHDFPTWWGYTSLFNVLDLPSVVLPLKDFKISAELDAKDVNYVPLENPFDRITWEMYDPRLFQDSPVALQLVGLPYQDEELVQIASILDSVINK